MKKGVIGLQTFIHTKFVCVGNHTRRITTLEAARPLPKHLAPLSTDVIMNLAPLLAFELSHLSGQYVTNKEGEQFVDT